LARTSLVDPVERHVQDRLAVAFDERHRAALCEPPPIAQADAADANRQIAVLRIAEPRMVAGAAGDVAVA
jgi:hypothetical protein